MLNVATDYMVMTVRFSEEGLNPFWLKKMFTCLNWSDIFIEIIYLCMILRKYTLREIGKAFGITDYSSAGSAFERLKKELLKDRELQQKVPALGNLF